MVSVRVGIWARVPSWSCFTRATDVDGLHEMAVYDAPRSSGGQTAAKSRAANADELRKKKDSDLAREGGV